MSKSVRLDERVYAVIAAHKREEETFSEAIERLIDEPSLLDLAGILSDEDADELREAVADSRERWNEDRAELLERFGSGE